MANLEGNHCDLRHSDRVATAAKLYLSVNRQRGPLSHEPSCIEWSGDDRANKHDRVLARCKVLAGICTLCHFQQVSAEHHERGSATIP